MKNELWIDGDLCQMMAQSKVLTNMGIKLRRSDIYRIVSGEDVKRALSIIWSQGVDGWWHYKKEFVENGICTAEQYIKRLQR